MELRRFVSQRIKTGHTSDFTFSTFPKISVITPSYGQEKFIERTILSVLNQNYPNLEFIIVDDASKDDSNKIINKYSDCVTLVGDGVNRGQTAAINYGLKLATGDIITFQNADDLFAPNAFNDVAKAYWEYPDSELFFGNIYIVDENDTITNTMRMAPYAFDEQLYLGMQMHNQAMFFKPSLLQRYGYLDESLNYSFDYEIMLRFTESRKANPKYLKDLWGAFRIHSLSKTTNITADYKQERVTISERYKRRKEAAKSYNYVRFKSYLRKLFYNVSQGEIGYLWKRVAGLS